MMEDGRVQRLLEMLNALKKERRILTQAEFGGALGMKPAQISEILNGKRPLTDKTINRILVKFPDINPEWLKDGEGEMKRIIVRAGNVHVSGHHNEVNGVKKVNGVQNQYSEDIVDTLKMALNEIAEQRKVVQQCQENLRQCLDIISRK